jgi:predicted Zn-dependent peptidase
MNVQPPAPGPVSDVVFPEIDWAQLPSGTSYATISDRLLPRVSILVGIPAGRVHDPESLQGVAELVGDTLKEGTRGHSSREIAELFDRKAISFSAEVLLEYSVFAVSCLKDQLPTALTIFSEVLTEPVFPEVELVKARARWQSILIAQRADAGFLANERFVKLLFPGHPYGRVAPTVAQLQALTSAQVNAYYRRSFPQPGSRTLFAGDITPEESEELVLSAFGSWKTRPALQAQFPEALETPPRVAIVNRPHSAQARLAVGMRTIPRSDADFDRLRLANQVLGGGASARLFLKLREQKGYSYGVYSSLRGYRQDGLLQVSCALRADKTGEAVSDILAEMQGLETTPPDAAELDRCKAEIIGSFLRRVETPASVASLEMTGEMAGLPEGYYRSYVTRIQGVSPEDVERAALGHIRPETATVVAVGNADELEPQLREFGTVAIYDSSGNQVQ